MAVEDGKGRRTGDGEKVDIVSVSVSRGGGVGGDVGVLGKKIPKYHKKIPQTFGPSMTLRKRLMTHLGVMTHRLGTAGLE